MIRPSEVIMKPKSFAEWAAAGGHVPKGVDPKKWGNTVKKYAEGGEVKMQDGGAAFGVFPQMRPRRSKQDREAAKTFPIDVARGVIAGTLGVPGDIESIVRLPYELITDQETKTFFPTSDEIERRLPLRSDTPAARFASGIGQLAGGAYTGPGSGVRAVTAVPKAVVRAGKDFVMAAPQGAPRMFIGPKAKTWDQVKADRAAQMEKEGKDPVDIWRETGTFRSADGILRQEISDVGAVHRGPTQLKELGKQKKEQAQQLQQRIAGVPGQKDMFPKALTEARRPAREQVKRLKEEADELGRYSDVRGQRAKFVLEHPELYRAYPELADITVYQGGRGIGSESAALRGGKRDMEMEVTQKGLRGDPRSSMLHEMQHAVQTVEDMAPGGNTLTAFNNREAYKILDEIRARAAKPMTYDEYVEQLMQSNPSKNFDEVDQSIVKEGYENYLKRIPKEIAKFDREFQQQAAMEYYRRLAGEAEARATQFREGMTASQRANEFPYANYDVLPEDLIVKPAKRDPLQPELDMAEGGAAFGVFPQMRGRRSKQDREAAKTFPIDVARGLVSGALGMPGDIESLVRMLPGFSEKTILPTSEDIERRLPLRSDTPAARAATGMGQIAGGFYAGPLSGARAVTAVPMAVGRAGRDFVQAAGQPAVNVIKPAGGNWLTGSVERALKDLKTNKSAAAALEEMKRVYPPEVMARMSDETRAQVQQAIPHLEKQVAINNWIDRNLANYVKKQMATPEDPVRRLAEQGILHIEPQGGAVRAHAHRDIAGMPVDPTATSPLARAWEDVSDAAVVNSPYRDYLQFGESMDEGLRRVGGEFAVKNPDVRAYAIDDVGTTASNLGFDHIVDVLKQDLDAGRIRPEQLNKVSMEQAVRRTAEFDQEMAKRMREAQIKVMEGMPVYREYPEGYRWIELAAPDYNKLPIEERKQMIARLKEEAKQKGLTPEDYIERYPESQLEAALKYEGDTMGHCVGGYCPDVLEGRSRIFSLRDAKGEPHVTVEVEPNQNPYPVSGEAFARLSPAEKAQYREYVMQWRRRNPDVQELTDEHIAQALREAGLPPQPDRIVQIKGKQNRAPKEEYLPFVQDFVRSGQWSDVGDFANTGFINIESTSELAQALAKKGLPVPKYVAPNELTDLLKQAEVGSYTNPSKSETFINPNHPDWANDGGMKAGGEVKMQAGGIAKTLKNLIGSSAKEAGAAERAAAGRMAADVTKATQPMKMSEALGNLNVEGKGRVKVTQSDRTRVGGGNIGGAMFPGLSQVNPLYEGLVWGVGKKPTASSLINQSDDLTYWTTILGAEDQLKTNPIVFNKLRQGFVDAMKQGKLDKELEGKINRNLSLTFGEGAEIRDPKIWQKADTFEKRAALADIMLGQGIPPSKGGVALGGEKSGKGVIFKPTDILKRETEPLLMHPEHGGTVPTFAVGPRLFQFSGGMQMRPDLHPGFPVLLEGQDLGMVFRPAPGEVAMRDFTQRMMNERGRKPGYYEWTMGEKGKGLPSQDITEEYLTHLQKAGYAEGGKVSGLSAIEKV
jgi:uncharacterized short protein YbdD (DUF466 family)